MTEKPPPALPPGGGTPPRRLRSEELFGAASRVVIEHNGAEYRLQLTRQGKLILTK